MKKVREPNRSSLRELFNRIQHVRYAVISPFHQLPMEVKGKLILLTDNFNAISNLWNLTKFSPESQYTTILADGTSVIVTILEKGRNVFPETFESEILLRATLHENCVKVPDSEVWPLALLFWKLVYEKLLAEAPFDRKAIMDWIFRRTGQPIRTKYRWMSWDACHVIR